MLPSGTDAAENARWRQVTGRPHRSVRITNVNVIFVYIPRACQLDGLSAFSRIGAKDVGACVITDTVGRKRHGVYKALRVSLVLCPHQLFCFATI